jgi:two-component system sensor kinase FixL
VSTSGMGYVSQLMPQQPYISQDMRALLDAAVDAAILIDHTGTMLVANRSTERMFGYTQAELIGRNVSLLMSDSERRMHDDYIRRYITTGEARVIGRGRQVLAVRRDGSSFPAQLSVGVVPGVDPPRFAGFIHDLTDDRERDAEVRRAQEQLAQVARFAAMGELAGGIAHELNQPLAAIATYAQASERLLSLSSPDLRAVSDALGEIASQALRAGEIIRRLRQLVRERKTEQRFEDLNEVVREIDALVAADMRRHGVMLRYELMPDLPRVRIDRVQIQQVLLNLVRNAMEAVAGLESRRRLITVGTRACGPREVEAYVADLGDGVDAAAADRMFDPFYTTKSEGTGLGLAISRTIARAHHATLAWRRREPHGAEFYLRLPVQES